MKYLNNIYYQLLKLYSMEEKESSNEKLIETVNISNKVRNNIKSPTQILEKSLEEKICFCCIDYDLSISEYKLFIEIKKKVTQPYDEKNENHELSLQTLLSKTKEIINKDKEKDSESSDLISNVTLPTNNNNLEEDIKIWRKIGFQTGNPRTDFRAGGIFSLELMIYYANNYENEYINIINEDYFTFALVCIRLSYLIRIFLFLLSNEEINVNLKYQKNIVANRKELKNFCYFLYDNNNLLFDICSISLGFIYQKFIEKKKAGNKEMNYFIIDPIVLSSIECLKNALNNINFNDDLISELKKCFRENFLQNLE